MSHTVADSQLAILGGPLAVPDSKHHDEMFRWPIVTDEDEQAVLEVLRARSMSDTDITTQFEAEYARYNGSRYALSYPNETLALQVAMWSSCRHGSDPGDCPKAQSCRDRRCVTCTRRPLQRPHGRLVWKCVSDVDDDAQKLCHWRRRNASHRRPGNPPAGHRVRPLSGHDQLTLSEVKPFRGVPLGAIKGRLNQTCAAMGRVQLKYYQERIAEIQKAMKYFWDLLEDVPGLRAHRPVSGSGSTMGGWYNPLALYVPEELGGLAVEKFIDAV
jgi:hypothetical protein